MVRLTSKYTEGAFYVNPDHIISIGCNNAGGTTVELTTDIEGAVRHVTESPAEVARKVLEWRLAMEDYRHSVGEYKMLTRNVLEELAGLEEPNHDT